MHKKIVSILFCVVILSVTGCTLLNELTVDDECAGSQSKIFGPVSFTTDSCSVKYFRPCVDSGSAMTNFSEQDLFVEKLKYGKIEETQSVFLLKLRREDE